MSEFEFWPESTAKAARWLLEKQKKTARNANEFSKEVGLSIRRMSDGSFRSLSSEELVVARQFIEDYFKDKGLTVHGVNLRYVAAVGGRDIWWVTCTVH